MREEKGEERSDRETEERWIDRGEVETEAETEGD
jgi:hypothetical protein